MDRLRRLDAMFAERVLGRPCAVYGYEHRLGRMSPPPVLLTAETLKDWPTSEQEDKRLGPGVIGDTRSQVLLFVRDYDWNVGLEEGWIPPHYTRSLDAAWEGLAKIDDYAILYRFRNGHVVAKVDKDGRTHGYVNVEDHPAEALVLACLRAVGCSEEELK